MCDALEVAPLALFALFAPPYQNSADMHIIKNNTSGRYKRKCSGYMLLNTEISMKA
jgi:hypothetical protein